MVEQRSKARDAGRQPDTSVRLCAATRAQRAQTDLIRFVAGPDGALVPDLARRLPGRGVWVTADHGTISRAVASRAFARSLKKPIEVPADLADQVDRLLVQRTAGALSLANKAGLVLTGFEKVDRAIAEGRLAALVHASDAASDGRGKLDRKFLAISRGGDAGRIVAVLTVEQMSLAIGRPNVVHAGLNKGGASDRFLAEAGRLTRYRSGIGLFAERPLPSVDSGLSADRAGRAPAAAIRDPLADPSKDV